MLHLRVPDTLRFTLLAASMLAAACTLALPEDAQQDILVDAAATDAYLDEGLIVYTGSADAAACITQGTLKICGGEIRIERGRGENRGLQKVTATGTPATYQQQLEADQGITYASGLTLVFDNVARLVIADGEAKLTQAGTVLTHEHVEYNLDTHVAHASGKDGVQGRMVSPGTKTDE